MWQQVGLAHPKIGLGGCQGGHSSALCLLFALAAVGIP